MLLSLQKLTGFQEFSQLRSRIPPVPALQPAL
jgi:hypothetical protein